MTFVYFSMLDDEAKDAIKAAMDDFKLHTCIRFQPKKPNDTDYLSFFDGDGYVF